MHRPRLDAFLRNGSRKQEVILNIIIGTDALGYSFRTIVISKCQSFLSHLSKQWQQFCKTSNLVSRRRVLQ